MSENVEMYLVSIARMADAVQGEIVPIPALADQLDILPVSANQMIRKMEENGLVRYLPYKGVQLTDDGRRIAVQVRRHHQLWASFLVRCLGFSDQTADELACRLEHVMTDEEIDRLAAFLMDPESFLGDIDHPNEKGKANLSSDVRLSDSPVGHSGLVTGISADRASASFLTAMGIKIGAKLMVLAATDSRDRLVMVDEHNRVHLASDLADQVWLEAGQS